ncbi:MAG: PHP domain-containing protein, partial [Ruoffia tabacinasalis]
MLLNVQSEYSLLSSTLRINDYIKEAKRLGYDAIGLADNQVLHGALQFYTRANKMGLKPLIGLNLTLIGGIRQDERYPFMLYAKSEAGYHHLIKISRMVENNHIDDLDVWTYLEQQATDLVYISSGRLSEMEQAI